MATAALPSRTLPGALRHLADVLARQRLQLAVSGVEDARRVRDELVGQIGDYLVPRLEQMDAPLLMVVGGSTGAGKSTLVNSLVGEVVSASGVLRPTTRAPVLVCSRADVGWFEDDRVLPDLARTIGGAAAPTGLHLVPTDALAPGLALLDAPDIDSVVEANRTLARQLLAAADAWLFVTTASRYADAVPWELLHAARERGTALSLVLNRVPAGAAGEIVPHLAQMLAERGLAGTEVLVVPETGLEGGRLPVGELAPVRRWLDELGADAEARAGLIRRTIGGALDSVPTRAAIVKSAVDEQRAAAQQLRADVEHAYARALDDVAETVRNGSLLRGEVLARWHDVIGTGDVMRALETRIGWARDRLRQIFSPDRWSQAELRGAVESSVDAVVHAAADRAAEDAAAAWRASPPGRPLLEGAGRLDAASPRLLDDTRAEVREWQAHVFELVSQEGLAKRASARLASLGVNGAGLAVMIAVFVHTGGLTGAEVVVAGGSSALGQRVLEAILGDQAVRSLADRAREDLLRRVERLLDGERARFTALLEPVTPDGEEARTLERALTEVQRSR